MPKNTTVIIGELGEPDIAMLIALNRLNYLTAAQASRLLYPNLKDNNRYAQRRLKKLVEAAGSNMDCLLKVIVWLKDQRQQEEFDRIYRSYFSSQEALPARTRMQAGRTPMDCGLEVEAIGYVP